MRGDRPDNWGIDVVLVEFTPHARGSTVTCIDTSLLTPVYPACAGIDLCAPPADGYDARLPRMRGDRPLALSSSSGATSFTPHARGSTRN